VKLQRNFRFNPALICAIPLVNVLFLVLIFFALSSRFILLPGLAVSLPTSPFSLEPRENTQLVSIVSAPIPTLYHRDQKVSVDELGQRLHDSPKRGGSLIIRADQRTPYDFVVQVMNTGLAQGYSIVLATEPLRK
jgi:biopolymer transport protein ExbD